MGGNLPFTSASTSYAKFSGKLHSASGQSEVASHVQIEDHSRVMSTGRDWPFSSTAYSDLQHIEVVSMSAKDD